MRTRRPLTLRSKLIIGIVALITAVCAVIGVTTEIFLSRYLVRQVDSQLTSQQNFAERPDGSRSGGTSLACPAAVTCAGQPDGGGYGSRSRASSTA